MAEFDETEFKHRLLNVDPNDVDAHADIYVYFRDHADMSKQPPLYLLIYAINNIVYPTFLIEQTPDILNLLGQVELLRRRAIKNCVNVLRLNNIYSQEARKQDKASVLLLSEEEEVLKDFKERSTTDRGIFINLVHWICLHHIRQLFTLGEDDQVVDYMTDYYGDDPESSLPSTVYYTSWTKSERELVAQSKQDAEQLRADVCDWEEEAGLPKNSEYDNDTMMLFERKFYLDLNLATLSNLIALYLKRVQEIVSTLERMFTANRNM